MLRFRLALGQMNATVGDLEGNARKIVEMMDQARSQGADLVVFPEMALPGYPPEDLLFKPQFIQDNLKQLRRIVKRSQGIAVVVGFVDKDHGDIYNAAAVAYNGKHVGTYHKIHLPNYGVFDEERYFTAGQRCPVFVIRGVPVGVNVCEDIWYAMGPTALQRYAGAKVIVNINASPYHYGKVESREQMLATRATDNEIIVSYTNMVGGQDELVFDGGSMVFAEGGELVARARQFEEDLLVVDLDVGAVLIGRPRERYERPTTLEYIGTPELIPVSDHQEDQPAKPSIEQHPVRLLQGLSEVYHALVTGTRDYVRKSGFQKVVIGLSGGIDSSLVAVIAADALGPENVAGVSMPSRYTSSGSKSDAITLAKKLGIRFSTIPIEGTFTATLDMLAVAFAEEQADVTEENLQARIRGCALMALSNKFGWLVLTTGNKSEMATGYATLYGDMAGGFAVLKDVPKTLVYELAAHRNSLSGHPVIPQSVLKKPPTAELRPDQKDEDSLPPYSRLDPILKLYVEEDNSFQEIVALGHDEEMVKQAIELVDRNEYKRRQAPPGVKITPRAFGRDWRLPIVNRYRAF